MADPDINTDEVGGEDGKLVRRWISELDTSERWRENYIARCGRIIRRYRNETRLQGDALGDGTGPKRFAILWSNIQTLGPAVYARMPEPVVSRRYKDADPVGRYASEVLERALSFSIDQYDFDERMKEARDDYLLLASGQVWVRYVPHLAETDGQPETPTEEINEDGPSITDQAQAEEQPIYAEVVCDHVNYADWGMQPCRSWSETGYVWRRVFMKRGELIERFGRKIGSKVPLDWQPKENRNADSEIRTRVKRAAIYEIWDKETGKVYWVSKSYSASVLDEKADWLSLQGFFPCPRPLMGTLTPDSYIPVPDYVYYQDQADELDELTARIGTLVNALRMVGIYAGEERVTLNNVFNGTNNQLIPVESMASLQDKGGLRGLIEWMPIDMVIKTLDGCYASRERALADIYQITGISDIVRGDTDPSETATAQGLKSQWGSLRVRDRQKEIARFARDIMRIKAEVIAKKFPVTTLKAMTDVKLLTNEEKQQYQIQAQALQRVNAQRQMMGAQPIPQPPPPEGMDAPSWEDVNALLKDDAMRSFRVDIETDSTVEPDQQRERAQVMELVGAVGQFFTAFGPVVQQQPKLAPFASDLLKYAFRRFNAGRELEGSLEKAMDAVSQMPPQQPGGAAQPDPMEAQVKALELQAQQQEMQQRGQLDAANLQLEQQRLTQDGQIAQADIQLRARDQQLKQIALERDPTPQGTA